MVKGEGRDNDLIERVKASEYFAPIHARLEGESSCPNLSPPPSPPELMDPTTFVGRAPEQVKEFLEEEVKPVLDRCWVQQVLRLWDECSAVVQCSACILYIQ